MSVQFPPPALILSSLRGEVENCLLPALGDSRSIHVAEWLSYLLAVLALREDKLKAALTVALERSRTLVEIHATDADATVPHATQSEERLLDVYRDVSGQMEQRIESADSTVSASRSHKVFVHDALAIEMELIDSLDPTVSKQRRGSASNEKLQLTPALINEYFKRKFSGRDIIATDVQSVGMGNSKDTFLVRLAGQDKPADEVIIRRDVPFSSVDSTVIEEYPLVERLHRVGFPVPPPLWLEADPAALGAPCIFVRKVPGETAGHLGSEGQRLVFTQDARENCGRELARTLALLHGLTLAELGFSRELQALPAREHIANTVRRSERYWKARRLAPSPILAAAFAWLKSHLPEDPHGPSLVHGDGTPRNLMLFQGRTSALLDWETAHTGDPSEDLFSAQPEITQVISWEEFLQTYYDHGGPKFLPQNKTFYELWSIVRNTVYASASLGGYRFQSERNLDVRFAYSGTYYYYSFLRQIAAILRSA